VKSKKILKLEDIYLHSLPIKGTFSFTKLLISIEYQIIDFFYAEEKDKLKDEVMKIMSVQKQTSAGQRTRFKAIVGLGDNDGHVGLGVKVAKEVQIAIKGALISAKLSFIPVRRGYWGNKIGLPHTVPMKVTGKCGSVRVRLIPAPRGTGIVGAPTSKKIISFAGVGDCFTSSQGQTKTKENFLKATFQALEKTYKYLSPDLWTVTPFVQNPYQKFSDELSGHKFLKEKVEVEEDQPQQNA
jgi:small subunit ribosomal protein S2e